MTTVIVLLALACWLAVPVGLVGSLANLSGKTRLPSMLFSRFEMFDRENFTQRGLEWRAVFFVGLAGFLTSGFVLIVLAPS